MTCIIDETELKVTRKLNSQILKTENFENK